jgi:thiol-disulfide isomerase/thioredoxin
MALAAGLALLVPGCGDGSSSVPPTTAAAPSTGIPSGQPGAASATSPTPTPQASSGSRSLVYDPNRDAKADIDAALALSRVDGKRVLVDFGADWCPDCLVLDKLYHTPTVEPVLSQGYHVVTVDIGPGDRNFDLSQRYGNVIENGIPALVVLDAHGAVLTTTGDGSFASARTMMPSQVRNYLRRWAGTSS